MKLSRFKLKKSIINFRPFLFMAISFAIGIFASYFFYFSSFALFVLLFSVFILSLFSFVLLSKNLRHNLIFSILFFVFTIFGFFSYSICVNNYEKANLNDLLLTIDGNVEQVVVSDDSQKLVINNVEVKGAVSQKLKYKVNVYVTNGDFSIGDNISYTSYLYDYNYMYGGKFSPTFLSEKIKYYSIVNVLDINVYGNKLNLYQKINKFISDSLKAGMSEKEYSVAYSMLLGGTDVIDEDVISSFRNTGVAHIFAVSGLHIGFLAMALSFALKRLRVKKLLKSFFIIAVLFTYAGVCGFSSSSVRAVIMASVLLLSNSFGRKYDMLSSVSIAFLLILLYRPIQLFCVGFRLSFSAVIGILLLQKKFEKLFSFMPSKIASSLATSISAQICTLPFLMMYFGKVSLISVFVNVLFIPIVSLLFVGLFILAIIGGIFSISTITLFIPKYCIKAFIYAISIFDSQIFLVSLLIPLILIIVYYCSVVCVSDIFNIDRLIKRISFLSLAVVLIIASVLYNISYTKKIKLTVSANSTIFCTRIDCENENTLIVSEFGSIISLNRLCRSFEDESQIKNLIIIDKSFSEQDLFSLLYQLCDKFYIENIYLPIEDSELKVLKKVFVKEKIVAIEDIYNIESNGLKIKFNEDESSAIVFGKNKTIRIMTDCTSQSISNNDNESCDLLVAYNNADVFSSIYKSKKTMVYSKSTNFYSALNCGNYTIIL